MSDTSGNDGSRTSRAGGADRRAATLVGVERAAGAYERAAGLPEASRNGNAHQPENVAARHPRVLVIDKVAVLRSNRERYRALVESTGLPLTLLTPTRWLENCVMEPYQPDEGEPFETILGVPSWPGRELRSIYFTGLWRAMRRARPDVILLMEESFSMFALQTVLLKKLLAPRAKVIFYSNNITSYSDYPYRPAWFYRLLGDTVMRMCHVGLCVNRRAEQVLAASSFKGRIRVLFYGINTRLFRRVPRDEARAALGIPADAKMFLYAGRLLELKGIQDLMDAFARLVAARPGERLKLIVVGDGEYGAALRERAETLGLGERCELRRAVPVEQIAAYMSAADAFVLPSRAEWNEQFGRVNAEAMLVGTTVIGSTSGEIPMVIEDGGFIFEAGNVADLERTMALALDDPEEASRRRERGRQIAEKTYSMQGFVDGLIEVIEDLVGRTIRRSSR